MNFEGKVAMITGASVGIGRACAIRFGELGAKLVLLDYNARLTCREAYQRAADATWPKWLFEAS